MVLLMRLCGTPLSLNPLEETMFQAIDDLRDHYLRIIPGIGAHEAHIRACRALSDAYLDAPTDIRLNAIPASKRVAIKAKK